MTRHSPRSGQAGVAEGLGAYSEDPLGRRRHLQAKTANDVLKSQERRLKLQKLKGELDDRARAEALVFRLAH